VWGEYWVATDLPQVQVHGTVTSQLTIPRRMLFQRKRLRLVEYIQVFPPISNILKGHMIADLWFQAVLEGCLARPSIR